MCPLFAHLGGGWGLAGPQNLHLKAESALGKQRTHFTFQIWPTLDPQPAAFPKPRAQSNLRDLGITFHNVGLPSVRSIGRSECAQPGGLANPTDSQPREGGGDAETRFRVLS